MLRRFLLLTLLVSSLFSLGTFHCYLTTPENCNGTPLLSLSNLTNAHVEVGRIQYDYVICCWDDYINFTVGVGDCDNPVLRILSANYPDITDTNAHAELPNETIYPTKVCINSENLSVTCGIGNYEVYILRLSNYTNAHVAWINYTDYPYLIGCNVSYTVGTICHEDFHCESDNCASSIDGSISVCSYPGFCYDYGFYPTGFCKNSFYCYEGDWIGDGDFNEDACYCVSNLNASWIGICCGDDESESLRTFKRNYDYDIYIDGWDWKGKVNVNTITKNCFSDFCPDEELSFNFALGDEWVVGFFARKPLNITIGSIKFENDSVIINGVSYDLNLSNDWNYILLRKIGNTLEVYVNRTLKLTEYYADKISSFGFYSKADEIFVVNRSVDDLTFFFENYDYRNCTNKSGCYYNGTLFEEGAEYNGYKCNGFWWDKIPEDYVEVNPSTVILDLGNSTNVSIRITDDDAREDWISNILIYKDGILYYNITPNYTKGRKEIWINFTLEFSEEGYYDIYFKYGDKNSNKTAFYDDIIYVATSAGKIESITIEPRIIRPGDTIRITVIFNSTIFEIPNGTTFTLSVNGIKEYEVLNNYTLQRNMTENDVEEMTFYVKVIESDVVSNVIPILRYTLNGSNYAVIPRVIQYKVSGNKKIYYQGDDVVLEIEPYLYPKDKIYNVETRIKLLNSNGEEIFEKYIGIINKTTIRIPTKNLPCDYYILEIEGRTENYKGSYSTGFVVTGCVV